MIKSQSNIEPQLLQKYNRGLLINFNVEEIQVQNEEGGTETQYEYEQVFVKISASREEIIAAIIHNHYPIDDEIATINNYLADPDNAKVKAKYEIYQARRAFAKTLVDGVMSARAAL